METSISPPGTLKAAVRKPSLGNSVKDLCLASKQGSIAKVESALALLKKSGGNIDGRNAFGLSALHLATWRNQLPIVRRLLDAGADPDARVCTVPSSDLISPVLKSIFSYPILKVPF
jgi:inhibitor of Bruton tyrosine kinase